MLKKGKKKLARAAMKLMMNEKVARGLMTAMQKKNEMNERLARLYATVQLPSLADHETVIYGMDRVRRRIKGLEKEIAQAEFALENIESAIEKAQTQTPKPVQKPKPAAKPDLMEGKLLTKKKPARKPPKAAKAKTGSKPASKTPKRKPAKKKSVPVKIAPLGAAGAKKTGSGGLLDLDFKKSGSKKKAK